jgi:hypothetical protein
MCFVSSLNSSGLEALLPRKFETLKKSRQGEILVTLASKSHLHLGTFDITYRDFELLLHLPTTNSHRSNILA